MMLLPKLVFPLLRIILLLSVIIGALWLYLAQPTWSSNASSIEGVSEARLRQHVKTLSVDFHPRNYREHENLNRTANYIFKEFQSAGASVRYQGFAVGVDTYRNVVATFNEGAGEVLVIGAHYDSCEDTPGADDNASGVAGLIELAHLLGKSAPQYEIQLVAYTLEEPPYFATNLMGSYQHALKLVQAGAEVKGVIVLEMIGYFSDEFGSQSFPSKLLHLIYPSKGNFIAVVGNEKQRAFSKEVKKGMKGAADIPVYSLNAPEFVAGIDFSDHRNYWPHGINAVMVSDTAFYRNHEYHKQGDTYDRLNYEKMGQVVVALHSFLNEG